MKPVLFFLALFVLATPYTVRAQKPVKPTIQYVTLTDTVLVTELKKYIDTESKHDPLFATGKGYILVRFSYERKDGRETSIPRYDRVDTVFTYFISTSFMAADGAENTLGDMYPTYYTFVNGRLVCFMESALYSYFGFSEDSKKRYREMLKKHIEPAGSKSRTRLVVDRETRVYFLKSVTSKKVYDEYVTVNGKR